MKINDMTANDNIDDDENWKKKVSADQQATAVSAARCIKHTNMAEEITHKKQVPSLKRNIEKPPVLPLKKRQSTIDTDNVENLEIVFTKIIKARARENGWNIR
eukprot:5437956-Ditylum_brightwellii.AAC.1